MELMHWLTETVSGEFIWTMLVSMVPVVELRGGIPFGVAAGLPVWLAMLAAMVGNMIPVPFIIVYVRRVFQWMREHLPMFRRMVDGLERKAHRKGTSVSRYKYLGLAIFVGIPLPGTGAWTGALVAAVLGMPLRKAVPSILLGVIIAGVLIALLTAGVISLF